MQIVRFLSIGLMAFLFWPNGLAQGLSIPYGEGAVLIDGHLTEWRGVSALSLIPASRGVRTEGEFSGPEDLEISIQAQWDDEALYLAIHWKDNAWDVQQVRRQESVFLTPDKRRRQRMLFFDYLKFQIHELEFDYLLWMTPRIDNKGPYFWQRRMQGIRNYEAATAHPAITPKELEDGSVTMELMLRWKDLELKPKKLLKKGLPLSILVADSDSPGLVLESKLANLRWIEWNGVARLGKKKK